MKRTNIVLDVALIEKARKLTGLKTIREIVEHALRELVRRKRQRDILELQGKVDWVGDLSSLRRGRRY